MSTVTSHSRPGRNRGKIIAAVTGALFVLVALLITGLKAHHDVPIDPTYGTPPPPNLPYPAGNNVGVTIVMTIVGLSGIALGIHHWIRKGTPLPLLIAVSGALICIPEVFYDVIGGVYFPWSATQPLGEAYQILGRHMPWWIVAGWFGYGGFNFFMFTLLSAKPKTKTLWLMLGGAAVGDVVFEEILLSFNVYHYYGNQPLILISQLPWWWIPCNSVGVFLAAALAYRFQEFLRGWRSLLMLVITPMSVTTVYGAIALPSWIAVNGNYGWLPTQLLGLLTLALGIVVFALILELVLKRKPFEPDYAPAKELTGFGSPSGTSAPVPMTRVR